MATLSKDSIEPDQADIAAAHKALPHIKAYQPDILKIEKSSCSWKTATVN